MTDFALMGWFVPGLVPVELGGDGLLDEAGRAEFVHVRSLKKARRSCKTRRKGGDHSFTAVLDRYGRTGERVESPCARMRILNNTN